MMKYKYLIIGVVFIVGSTIAVSGALAKSDNSRTADNEPISPAASGPATSAPANVRARVQIKKDEIKQRIEEKRQNIEQKVEQKKLEIRQKINEKKASSSLRIDEKRRSNILKYFENMIKRFEAALNRQSDLSKRISSRLDKFAQAGKDVGAFRTKLSAINTKIDSAKSLVSDSWTKVNNLLNVADTTLKEKFADVRLVVKDLVVKVKEIHQDLVKLITEIKGAPKPEVSESPEVSPTTSLTPTPTSTPSPTPSPSE